METQNAVEAAAATPAPEREFACTLCERRYPTAHGLKCHMGRQHGQYSPNRRARDQRPKALKLLDTPKAIQQREWLRMKRARAAAPPQDDGASLGQLFAAAVEDVGRAERLVRECFDGLDKHLAGAKRLRLVCITRTDQLKKLQVEIADLRDAPPPQGQGRPAPARRWRRPRTPRPLLQDEPLDQPADDALVEEDVEDEHIEVRDVR